MKQPLKLITKYPNFFMGLLAGVLWGFSRWPGLAGLLIFIAFAPLLYWFNPRRYTHGLPGIFSFSAGFAFAYIAIALHWITLVTAPGLAGIVVLFWFYFWVVIALAVWVGKRHPRLYYPAFILFWLAFEYYTHWGEFRFPWLHLGYSLSAYNTLVQIAELGGIWLAGVLILAINALFAALLANKRNWPPYIIAIVSILVLWNISGYWLRSRVQLQDTGQKIAIAQASIPQEFKWQPSWRDSSMFAYMGLTKQARQQDCDLVIWPESAAPLHLLHNTMWKNRLADLAHGLNIDIFTGIPHYVIDKDHPGGIRYYNTATAIYKTGKIAKPYYKNALVPFGERMPFLGLMPFLWDVKLGQANFEPGDSLVGFDLNGYSYYPLICFEIAFDRFTTQAAAKGAAFFVNQSNDAWYKRSLGTWQHSLISRWRAVETRTMVCRAANTGYSFFAMPGGEYLHRTQLFTKQMITTNLVVSTNGPTIFTRYRRFITGIILGGAALILLLGLVLPPFKGKGVDKKTSESIY